MDKQGVGTSGDQIAEQEVGAGPDSPRHHGNAVDPEPVILNPAVKLAPVAESPAPFSDERKSPPEAAAPIG